MRDEFATARGQNFAGAVGKILNQRIKQFLRPGGAAKVVFVVSGFVALAKGGVMLRRAIVQARAVRS